MGSLCSSEKSSKKKKKQNHPQFELDTDLRSVKTNFGWTVSEQHKSVLESVLNKWKLQMVLDIIVDYSCDESDKSCEFRCCFRTGLFSDERNKVDLITPINLRDINNENEINSRLFIPDFDCRPSAFGSMFRISLFGPRRSGKTALWCRWEGEEPWHPEYDPDINYSGPINMAQNKSVSAVTFSNDENETEQRICEIQMQTTDVLILCADLTEDKPLEDVYTPYLKEYLDLNQIEIDQAKVILVGMKADLEVSSVHRTWDVNKIHPLSQKWNFPYIECSSKYDKNVDLIFQSAVYEYWLKYIHWCPD